LDLESSQDALKKRKSSFSCQESNQLFWSSSSNLSDCYILYRKKSCKVKDYSEFSSWNALRFLRHPHYLMT
jgi:hypothetical protein